MKDLVTIAAMKFDRRKQERDWHKTINGIATSNGIVTDGLTGPHRDYDVTFVLS